MALTQREAFARIQEHQCSHDGDSGHGYSQPNRAGKGVETVDLGDGVRVNIPSGDRDCSSALCIALAALGIDIHGASYTGNLLNITKNPLFRAYKRPTSCSARRGDMYLAVGKHVAMCTHGFYEEGGDNLCQFSISENGTVNGATGDQTGRESNFKPFYDYPWDYTIAWTSDGETISGDVSGAYGTPGKESAPVTSSRFGDENWWGPLIAGEFIEQITGGSDDFLSDQSRSDKTHFWAVTGGVRYGSGGSDAIRALQRRIGADPDGYYGRETITDHQRALKDAGFYKGKIDGYHGNQTNVAVCAALKAGWYRG